MPFSFYKQNNDNDNDDDPHVVRLVVDNEDPRVMDITLTVPLHTTQNIVRLEGVAQAVEDAHLLQSLQVMVMANEQGHIEAPIV